MSESWVMVIHTIRINFFIFIFPSLLFCEYLFLWKTKFWKFRVNNFQPKRKNNKKKTDESRDIWLIFLSRSTERQEGHNRKPVAFDSNKQLNEPTLFVLFFFFFFFYFCFREIWIFLHNYCVSLSANAV